jgi:hypothetical protein
MEAQKHGPEYRRQWRKRYIGIDAKTLQIRAFQLTTNNVSDSRVLGDLLIQIHKMSGLTLFIPMELMTPRQCRQVIAIADRQSACGDSTLEKCETMERYKSSSLERNELLRTVKRLEQDTMEKMVRLSLAKLVETKMHCIKLLGDKLSARSFDSQVNEIHACSSAQQIYGIRSTIYPSYALNLAQLGALCISNLCATKPLKQEKED